jgi:hypothetical protein
MGAEVSEMITFFFIGCLIVLVVTHSSGFALSAGTIFKGVNQIGLTLAGS